MDTPTTRPVVVTPVYWSPSGHGVPAGYRSVINQYLKDVAAASGTNTNVYSTVNEYFGSNGHMHYSIRRGPVVVDRHALAANGCTLEAADRKDIYGDGSGYNACLDDSQVIRELERVRTSLGTPADYAHIYVMFLPKHVESCFYPGSTATAANFCTINHEPSAAYCAYHGQNAPDATGMVYANMPFPIYESPVGFTCGSEATLATNEAPNGNVDADVEISPTSHEIMESLTDPDVSTGWYTVDGYENGDMCAYVYGETAGSPGALYNQVINGHHYLTQLEWSNKEYFATGGGCVKRERFG
jgi:hypothetical protein